MALVPDQLLPVPDSRAVARPARRFAVLLLVAFAITAVGLLAAPRPAEAWSSGSFSSASEKQLVSLTNQSRASAGLKALKVDAKLTSIARWRSKDMITRGYFSHNIPPQGYNVFHVLDTKGYCYAVAGENIGWNNFPDDIATGVVHNSFMKSSGHRANILGKRWEVIGVGAYKGPTGKKMWTVIFADRCGATKASSGGGTTAKATSKPKSQPRATPRPTPKPTPVKTMPPEPTDVTGLGIGPGGRHQDDGSTSPPPDGSPPGEPANGDAAFSLRVVDPAPPGLIETIVGGVTGFYLGG